MFSNAIPAVATILTLSLSVAAQNNTESAKPGLSLTAQLQLADT